MSSQSQVSERAETPETNPLADMVFVPGGDFRRRNRRALS